MPNKFLSLLAAMIVLGGSAALVAEETKPAKGGEGTLMVQDKNYPLTHALAYETTMDETETIVVVLSGQAISPDKLKEARGEEKDGHDPSFNKPYLKLAFTKDGKLNHFSAAAGISAMSKGASAVSAELKLENGKVIGKASQPNETQGNFHSGFDVHFDTALVGAEESLAAKKTGPAANVKPMVTGEFKGNGQDGKLAYVSANWREPFDDKPSIVLVFTEKDHSKDKKADFNASFGKFGNALIVSLHEDGSIFGCQVVHSAHKHQGFTALGKLRSNNFEYADGKVEGELTTDGPDEVFGDTWEANFKFVAPLGETPAQFQPAAKKSVKAAKKNEDDDDDAMPAEAKAMMDKMSGKSSATKPAANQLNAIDLAMTKDASDVEFQSLMQHVKFKSKLGVKSACSDLSANLKAQGWSNDGSDLITPASSILKRKRGSAALTIFVKPDSGGSAVQIFTEGLSWDGQ